mmetsp:Transcript_7226/g.17587  ORF Transcript_7226/g.17587 Transcript_7226/m.17587 type:complete len:166 (+) Transcript_7226:618-1115(+)
MCPFHPPPIVNISNTSFLESVLAPVVVVVVVLDDASFWWNKWNCFFGVEDDGDNDDEYIDMIDSFPVVVITSIVDDNIPLQIPNGNKITTVPVEHAIVVIMVGTNNVVVVVAAAVPTAVASMMALGTINVAPTPKLVQESPERMILRPMYRNGVDPDDDDVMVGF